MAAMGLHSQQATVEALGIGALQLDPGIGEITAEPPN